MTAPLYVNLDDSGVLALMMLVIIGTIVGSLLLLLGLSHRYVRRPASIVWSEIPMYHAESERRRKLVRRVMALIMLAFGVAGFIFVYAVTRTQFSICMMSFCFAVSAIAMMVRSRWSYD